MGLVDGRVYHGRRRSRQPDAPRRGGPRVRCHAARELAMSRVVGYRWHLGLRMAERGMFATTELGPLLAERGGRVVARAGLPVRGGTPERLSLHTLAALCDILDCTPSDLIEPVVESKSGAKRAAGAKPTTAQAVPRELRPKRARIITHRCGGAAVSAGAARLCGRCGRVRPISKRADPDGPDICSSCWRPPTAVCTGLRRRTALQRSRGRTADLLPLPATPDQPLRTLWRNPAGNHALAGADLRSCHTAALRRTGTCTACGRHRRLVAPPGHAARTCAACSGAGPPGHVCTGCGIEDKLYTRGYCARCTLVRRTDELLADRSGTVPVGLAAVRDAIVTTSTPRTALNWLRKGAGAAVLAALGPRRHRTDPRSPRRPPERSAGRLSARHARRPRCPAATRRTAGPARAGRHRPASPRSPPGRTDGHSPLTPPGGYCTVPVGAPAPDPPRSPSPSTRPCACGPRSRCWNGCAATTSGSTS